MKLSIDQQRLLELLQTVSKAAATRSPRPILGGILLEAHQSCVVATCYDMEIGMKEAMGANTSHLQVEEQGCVVLPTKQILDIVRRIGGDTVHIEVNLNHVIKIRCDQFECELYGLNPVEFPGLPTGLMDAQSFLIPSIVLKEMVRSTAFAASKSEARPVLTGVCVEFKDRSLRLAATDSIRLASFKIPFDVPNMNETSNIIPAKSLLDLTHVLPDDNMPVSVTISPSHCVFEVGSLQFFTRLIEGTYLDVTRLVPRDCRTEIVLDTRMMIRSIDRASVLAPRNQEIGLLVRDTDVLITTQSSESGTLTDTLPTKSIRGDATVHVAFHARHALEALRTCDADEVAIRLTGPNQPIVIVPRDEHTDLIHVISPIVTR